MFSMGHFHSCICVICVCVCVYSDRTTVVGYLISGFHRASLLLVTFINQLMHSIDTVVDVKIFK